MHELSEWGYEKSIRDTDEGSAVSGCTFLRGQSDPGEISIEPDANGSRTASSSADRNGRKKCKSIRRSNAYLRTVKVSSTVCDQREENERIKK